MTGQPRKDTERKLPPAPDDADALCAGNEAAPSAAVTLVAVASSAGGLDPLKRFISTLPPDSGAAFVVVQHLAPDSTSLLSELLAARTVLPVVQVNEDMTVEPNSIYVIAPNTYLAFQNGKLCICPPPEQHRLRLPADFLFRSLAEQIGPGAVGIVLSGTGSDGTLGIGAIRGAGGLTIAQEPSTAQYDDMPRHAIATGLVDLVLPVEEMAAALLKHAQHPFLRKAVRPERLLEKDASSLDALLAVLRTRASSDFRWYRRSALLRRVARRMGIAGIESFDDYTRLLHEDAREVTELVRDLLIGVTRFFRDPEAYEQLERLVIRPLVRTKAPSTALRVWTAGCGSGEEAYSIAMLVWEALEAEGRNLKIQMFATDLDERSLQKARDGVYPLSIAEDVSPERLERFFVREENAFRIRPRLREAVVFAAHNLVADPPFCHIDLISCRNLLIYVEPDVQKKIISLFHFSLASDGYLFLGKAESAATQPDLFEPLSSDARILHRLDAPRRVDIELPVYAGRGRHVHVTQEERPQREQQALDDILKNVVLSHFGAAAVLMDEGGRIIRFFGRLDRYLSISSASGKPELNLLEMARDGLSVCLTAAVRDTVNTRQPQSVTRVALDQDDGEDVFLTDVTVLPVSNPNASDVLVAVVLERSRDVIADAPAPGESGNNSLVEHLRKELRLTQEDLRHTVAELQSANEELKVANEEATSMNEEMQSTNEELETSKEELQSINEELTSVNVELQDKLAELNETNSDMSNLLNSTAIATLFLDSELNIRFFTRLAEELLNLRPVDKGRPISHLAHNLVDLDLVSEAAKLKAGGESIRREVRDRKGLWYMVHLLHYENGERQPDGVIVTFTDITELKLAEEKTRRLAAVLTASNDAFLLVGTDGRIQEWNRGAQKMYGWTAEEALGKTLLELVPPDSNDSNEALMARLSRGEEVQSFETQRLCKDGRIVHVWVTASAVSSGSDVPVIALTERDLTAYKQQAQALQERAEQLQHLTSELVLTEQRERRRFASLLHDHLQQLLIGAKFGLKVLSRQVSGDAGKAVSQVDDLLDQAVSALRSLSVELSPPILHEAGLAAGLDWLVRWMEEKHGLQIDLQADRTLFVAREDVRLLLFQSVRELLLNVVKHAKVTTARVELARHGEKSLRVVVADRGVGFAPADAYSLGKAEGGVGLYSIRERMRTMGGSFEFESSPGAGARFVLIAPLEPAASPGAASPPTEPAEPAAPSAGEEAEESDGKPRIRVLLVDDHHMVRKGFAAVLSGTAGIAVVGEAADGLEALQQARSLNPDIVLMDSSMPNMNGVEATRQLREEMPHIQVIGLSMYQEPDRAAAMREAGAAAYVSKSDAADTLVDAVLQVYARRENGSGKG